MNGRAGRELQSPENTHSHGRHPVPELPNKKRPSSKQIVVSWLSVAHMRETAVLAGQAVEMTQRT